MSENETQITEELKEFTLDDLDEIDKVLDKEFVKPSIEQVAWVFEHLSKQLQEGGSFRYLIYNRLGFDMDAYLPLYEAGGMNISNALYQVREINRQA